uniref:Uncharacterized protein n=1 Tax=Cannabis sativa TaxID=3483 RepID=A0A803RAE9_CANSA
MPHRVRFELFGIKIMKILNDKTYKGGRPWLVDLGLTFAIFLFYHFCISFSQKRQFSNSAI